MARACPSARLPHLLTRFNLKNRNNFQVTGLLKEELNLSSGGTPWPWLFGQTKSLQESADTSPPMPLAQPFWRWHLIIFSKVPTTLKAQTWCIFRDTPLRGFMPGHLLRDALQKSIWRTFGGSLPARADCLLTPTLGSCLIFGSLLLCLWGWGR